MKKLSFNIALSGILSAICLLMMFLVSIFPFFLYVFPMICGLIVYIIHYECGIKTSMSAYIAISILSLIISPDKESVLLFISFFGYYPILRVFLDKLSSKMLRWVIKLVVFNLAVIGSYFVLIKVFGLVKVEDFIGESGARAAIWGFVVLADIVFVMYDIALKRISKLYEYRLRKLIFKRAR